MQGSRLLALACLALLACGNRWKKPAPVDDSAETSTPETATAVPAPEAPIQVPIQRPLAESNEARLRWGSCSASHNDGFVRISCVAPDAQVRSLRAARVGQPEQAGTRAGGTAWIEISTVPMIVDVLGDVEVPPPEAPYGGRKQPADLAMGAGRSITVTVNPQVGFSLDLATTHVKGSLAPFESTLADLLRGEALAGFAKIATGPLLFANEARATDREPPPAAHSVLVLSAQPYFSVVSGKEDWLRGVRVLGPAKRVRDADLVAIEESAAVDSGKRCGGYRVKEGPDAGKIESLPLFIQKSEIILRERRTGREIAKKKFEATKTCPTGAHLTQEPRVRSDLDRGVVDRWLLTQLESVRSSVTARARESSPGDRLRARASRPTT